MRTFDPTSRDRVVSGLMSAGLVSVLGWLLVIGLELTPRTSDLPIEKLVVFDVASPQPPPVPIVPERTRNRRPEGEAAPPNLRSTATPVVAPVPIVVLPSVSPVIAAPVAGLGSDPSQGAAAVPGPGTGAGGIGNGTGSGGSGDGDGGGWEDETPPRRIRGRLRDSDYPEAAAEAGASGTVSVRYAVEVNGRVSGCRVTRSSGNAALDATTCRLITERFRYRPSLDARGRPVRVTIVVDHEWSLEAVPAEPSG
jgi:protein TonB